MAPTESHSAEGFGQVPLRNRTDHIDQITDRSRGELKHANDVSSEHHSKDLGSHQCNTLACVRCIDLVRYRLNQCTFDELTKHRCR